MLSKVKKLNIVFYRSLFWIFMYFILHWPTVSEDAGTVSRTVATLALAIRRSVSLRYISFPRLDLIHYTARYHIITTTRLKAKNVCLIVIEKVNSECGEVAVVIWYD